MNTAGRVILIFYDFFSKLKCSGRIYMLMAVSGLKYTK